MIVHIFNTTGKRDLDLEVSYDEMIQRTYEDIEGAKEIIELVNSSEKAKKSAEKFLNKEYVMKDDEGRYFINDMLIKLDLFTFKLEQSIYKNGISIMKSYSQNGIITNTPEYEKLDGAMKTKTKKISFKDAFLRYVELVKNPFRIGNEADELVLAQPLIVDAYYKLGVDRVRSLRYIKKDIEAALVSLDDDKSIDNKVAKLLQSNVIIGFNTTTALQSALAEAYTLAGKKVKTVKATDIEQYFDCKALTKRIDGKVTRGYELYRSKIVFG